MNEAAHVWNRRFLTLHGNQRRPNVQYESLTTGALYLDATSSDLVRTSVDANPHDGGEGVAGDSESRVTCATIVFSGGIFE